MKGATLKSASIVVEFVILEMADAHHLCVNGLEGPDISVPALGSRLRDKALTVLHLWSYQHSM